MPANDKSLDVCVECGEPIRLPDKNPCFDCRAAKANPEYAKQRAEDLKRKALMVELGMPSDALWNGIKVSEGALGEKWKGYTLEVFGMIVNDLPDPCPWPFWRLFDRSKTEPGLVMQLWQQRVFYNNSQVFAEVRWHPTEGYRMAIKGLEHYTKNQDIDFAFKGLRLIHTIQRKNQSGRNEGNTELSPLTFKNLSIEAALKLGRKGIKLTKKELGKELGISRSSVYNYLEDKEELWQSIEAVYERARTEAIKS